MGERKGVPIFKGQGDGDWNSSEPLAVPVDLPEDTVQVRLALNDVNVVIGAASEPCDPATKDLARWTVGGKHPKPCMRIILLNWIFYVGIK